MCVCVCVCSSVQSKTKRQFALSVVCQVMSLNVGLKVLITMSIVTTTCGPIFIILSTLMKSTPVTIMLFRALCIQRFVVC